MVVDPGTIEALIKGNCILSPFWCWNIIRKGLASVWSPDVSTVNIIRDLESLTLRAELHFWRKNQRLTGFLLARAGKEFLPSFEATL